MEVIELCARSLQVAVMVKKLKTPQELLPTAADERAQVGRAKETMSLNVSQDVHVPRRQAKRANVW